MEKLKPLEHKFKDLFFLALKGFLTDRTGNYNQLVDVSKIKSIIIFPSNRIGDMVITLPLIDGLKKSYPHIRVSILASPKNICLIKDDKRFDEVFLYSKNIWRSPGELAKVKRAKFDCIIDTVWEDSMTSLLISHYCASGKPIVGLGKQKFSRYYDINFANTDGHIIDNTLNLLNAFGGEKTNVSAYAEPYLKEEHRRRSCEFFDSLGGREVGPQRIGINLSSGAPNRIWQKENWIELIRSILVALPESQLVLITLPSERGFAESIGGMFPNRVHLAPNNLDILVVSAIIRNLHLLVTPDTSLVHIARSFGVPVAGLYTRLARNFNLWHPYGMKEQAIRAVNEHDIFDIKVPQVMEKILLLAQSRQEVNR